MCYALILHPAHTTQHQGMLTISRGRRLTGVLVLGRQ